MGPTSKRNSAVSTTGERMGLNAGFVEPNRRLTSYLYVCDAASNPRTYRSDASGMGYCPQPRVLFDPCSSRSAAARGFDSWNDSDARCGMRTFSGLNVNDMFAVDVHGPSQLKRPAMCPSCLLRQSRAERDPPRSWQSPAESRRGRWYQHRVPPKLDVRSV